MLIRQPCSDLTTCSPFLWQQVNQEQGGFTFVRSWHDLMLKEKPPVYFSMTPMEQLQDMDGLQIIRIRMEAGTGWVHSGWPSSEVIDCALASSS